MFPYSSRVPSWLALTLGLAALTALSTGCAPTSRYSATAIGHPPAPAPAPAASVTHASSSSRVEARSRRHAVTQAEFATIAVANAYDIVAKLRPEFLLRSPRAVATGSFEGPVVYVDSYRFGAISTLTMIPVESVIDITYVTSVDALLRFGPTDGAGVIVVRTRR